jgi:hypothetical protein
MRLIDADKFKQEVAAQVFKNNINPEKANRLCEIIDFQQTVCEPEKVIEQLEQRKQASIRSFALNSQDYDLDRAIQCESDFWDDIIQIVKDSMGLQN